MIASSAFVLVMLVLIAGGPLERWALQRLHRDHEDGSDEAQHGDGAAPGHRNRHPGYDD